MVDLVTQNYMHTLFLYEFGVSLNVATAVRFYLQSPQQKPHFYYRWVRDRMLRTNVPRLDYNTFFILFENMAEKKEYKEWLRSETWFGCPQTTRMVVDLDGIVKFHISMTGKTNSYDLTIEQYSTTSICSNRRDKQQAHQIMERDFYNIVDNLLSMIESTQKIPFEHYNVK